MKITIDRQIVGKGLNSVDIVVDNTNIMIHQSIFYFSRCLNRLNAIGCFISDVNECQAAYFQTRFCPLILSAPEPAFTKGLFATFANIAGIKSSDTLFFPEASKRGIKQSWKVHFPTKLIVDAFLGILSIGIPGEVQEIMPHRQHYPFFKDPTQKSLLRFGQFTNLIYSCTDKAHGFIKGGFIGLHKSFYRLFSSLPPPVNKFPTKSRNLYFIHIFPDLKSYRSIEFGKFDFPTNLFSKYMIALVQKWDTTQIRREEADYSNTNPSNIIYSTRVIKINNCYRIDTFSFRNFFKLGRDNVTN